MSAVIHNEMSPVQEREIAALLEFLYGDKMVYLPLGQPEQLLSLATCLGFIDTDGYLTRKGRTLMARHYLD